MPSPGWDGGRWLGCGGWSPAESENLVSDQSPYRPVPADPPAASGEPDWTTGQGLGFLVALPGWIIFGLAALVGVNRLAAGTADTEQFGAPELVIVVVLMALFGVVIAVPGTIVFNKCKRR